jgi:outer membrane protein TolC
MRAFIQLFIGVLIIFPVYLFAQQNDLNFYIEKAKANSPFIHKNINEKKVVQLDIEQLKSIYSKPEVTVEAGVLFAPIISHDNNNNQFQLVTKDATDYSGYDLAATDGGQYQAVFSLKQGLFTGSKVKTFKERADIENLISDNNIELTNHELENAVTHQYILCLKSEKQAASSKQLIKVVEDELQTLQKLAENAIYKKTDVMLLEITRQNYLQEYETYLSEYKSNIYDLNLLCGINNESEVTIQDTTFQMNQEINSGSRFLTAFYLDSLSITADRKIYELKYKPDVNFFANGGMNAVYLPAFNRLGFATGLNFKMYLFDGNQRDIERQRSEIKLETLSFEKQKSIEQNSIQKNFTQSRIQSLNKRILLANNQLEQYNELLGNYKIQLENGQISVMDYKYLIKEISTKKQEKLMLEMEKQIVVNAWNYWNY